MAKAQPIPERCKIEDLAGQVFGRLRVCWYAGRSDTGDHLWLCLCQCGVSKTVRHHSLLRGATRSCTCLRRELHSTCNGLSKSKYREHAIWTSMRRRCNSPKDAGYANYGGRGINVCALWNESFLAWDTDMGPRPSLRHSVDRIDNDGGYWCGHCEECRRHKRPANCRWLDAEGQNYNRRVTLRLEYLGKTLTVNKWAARLGIPADIIRGRLQRGWAVEDALGKPYKPQAHFLTWRGLSLRIHEWSARTGIAENTIYSRLRKGWSINRTLSTSVTQDRHGQLGTPEYKCWQHMKAFCYNRACKQYPRYGGRGIVVCHRWCRSFRSFLKDVGKRPSRQHRLARRNVRGDFTPENCHWAGPGHHFDNREDRRWLTHDGKTLTVQQWAKVKRMNLHTLLTRLGRGWAADRVLTSPIRKITTPSRRPCP